jgi:hypothetical protein
MNSKLNLNKLSERIMCSLCESPKIISAMKYIKVHNVYVCRSCLNHEGNDRINYTINNAKMIKRVAHENYIMQIDNKEMQVLKSESAGIRQPYTNPFRPQSKRGRANDGQTANATATTLANSNKTEDKILNCDIFTKPEQSQIYAASGATPLYNAVPYEDRVAETRKIFLENSHLLFDEINFD